MQYYIFKKVKFKINIKYFQVRVLIRSTPLKPEPRPDMEQVLIKIELLNSHLIKLDPNKIF